MLEQLNQSENKRVIKICRMTFEFSPMIGGSITHTVDLARHMTPYCERQYFIVPRIEEDTAELDSSFPFDVYRVNYAKFSLLQKTKTKYCKWMPVVPVINFSFGLASIKKCLWLNRKYGIDIIHAHGIGLAPAAYITSKLIRKPAVVMLDGTSIAYSKASNLYETLILRLFPPEHLNVVDDGSPAPDKFRRMLGRRVTVIYHGIDDKLYAPRAASKSLRESLGLDASSFTVLSPHALNHVKSVDYAIKAFADFIKKNRIGNAYLFIAGDGPLRQNLEQLVRELAIVNRVQFLGSIPKNQMPDYYAIADVIVATSLYSNMNLAVQEPMACAKPVVAFDSGGTGKVVSDGVTGLLARSGDIEELSEKLLILYKDPGLRNRLGQNSRAFIVTERNWDKRIRAELDIYRKLLKTC